jgi:hypothetical protein
MIMLSAPPAGGAQRQTPAAAPVADAPIPSEPQPEEIKVEDIPF